MNKRGGPFRKVGSTGNVLDGDLLIKQTFCAGPDNTDGPRLTIIATIEIVGAFEAFNTVPYHNYECWGQGYRVNAGGISVTSEYLDDALIKWQRAYCKAHDLDAEKIMASMKIEGWPPRESKALEDIALD